jgi:DNA-binding NarL/FixJ family response regulator
LLERLRAERPDLLRRVIVTTGIPEMYVQDLDRTTIAGLLAKPIDVRLLEELLREDPPTSEAMFEAGGESPSER